MTVLIALWLTSWSMQAPAQTAAQQASLVEQLACAPMGLPAPPVAGMRLLGGPVHGRIMFATGDPVILSAGTSQGVEKGQRFFVRRPVVDASTKQPKVGALYAVHTAGWVTVVDAKDTMAIATVTHACDAMFGGDYIEPYVDPVPPSSALSGRPDFEHPGRIVLADEGRQTGYPGLVMLMNRGSEDGVRSGQTLTIFRATLGGQGPIVDVGRATVLSVSPQISVLRVDSAREAVYLGDLVAIHRVTQ